MSICDNRMLTQAKSSDNRDCDIRIGVSNGQMTDRAKLRPETAEVFNRLDVLGLKQKDLAAALELEENKISKTKAGERQFKATELMRALDWLREMERGEGYRPDADVPDEPPTMEYVPINILPTFGGMGGGGTGDGDRSMGLVPRMLIVNELHGKPADFLLINVRGDSMEPDFHHGDQLLIDTRDRSPAQPGPFALWDGEWGEYVVKNVERLGGGEVRMFSSNKKYSDATIASENTRIIGRPVWFGRRV